MSVTAPAHPATPLTVADTIAGRTLRKLFRSPQIVGISIAQSVVFILVFRYVIGGAIQVPGVSYVNYLIPGFVVAAALFTANGIAVAVAEDAASGVYDRFRSLPISGVFVLAGRAVSDALFIFFVAVVTLGAGFAVGLRPTGTVAGILAAVALVAVYALPIALIFDWLGLIAGNAQAAQGIGILGVPFSFLSSAFVPPGTMPAILGDIASYQPLTFMIDSARGLMLGGAVTRTFGHSLTFYVAGSLLWCAVLLAVFAPLAVRAYRRS